MHVSSSPPETSLDVHMSEGLEETNNDIVLLNLKEDSVFKMSIDGEDGEDGSDFSMDIDACDGSHGMTSQHITTYTKDGPVTKLRAREHSLIRRMDFPTTVLNALDEDPTWNIETEFIREFLAERALYKQ